MTMSALKYPSQRYKDVLLKVVDYFRSYPGVYAIVLTGSLARGKAVEGSCIDLHVFLGKREFDSLAVTIKSRAEAYSRVGGQICFYQGELEGGILFGDVRVDVGFTYGNFSVSRENSFDMTRDEFETTIGNLFAYCILLHEKGDRYRQLRRKYLPFYDDRLRKVRLEGTREEFNFKIWKTRWLAGRGEFIASLTTLLEAQRIFLQHVFIKEATYPIDYVKWIKEQCSNILRMPGLYRELVSIVDGVTLSRAGISRKVAVLEKLFEKYGEAIS